MKVLLLQRCLAVVTMLAALVSNARAQCNQPRIRKPWESYSAHEQALYIEALGKSMQAGYLILFTSIHVEDGSSYEAHQTCGFLLWHRRYLLAFENMLRSLDPRFACITIPYWNYFRDYAKFANQECNSAESCSSILPAFGGSAGRQRSFSILGQPQSGNCVSRPPLNSFCQEPGLTGQQCAGCNFRGNWRRPDAFPTVSYATVASLISRVTTYKEVDQEVQSSPHNIIHGFLSGVMGSYLSPSDPIFFSHHAAIDMLHHLFFECHVGKTMPSQWKESNQLAFQQCNYFAGITNPDANSTMYMSLPYGNNGLIAADKHPKLAPFFKDIGKIYYEYVDSRDMAGSSYYYDMVDIVNIMKQNGLTCTALNRPIQRRLATNDTESSSYQATPKGCGIDTTIPAVKVYTKYTKKLINKAMKKSCTLAEALEQVEIIECAYHNMTYGIEEFPYEFVQSFKPNSPPRCKMLLEEVAAGNKTILIDDWGSIRSEVYDDDD